MATALQALTYKLAERFEMGDGVGLTETLKETAFSGVNVNDAQMVALLVIANQYQLNPWTKEIYAFPNNAGITPIVGVDGWIRIINREPQYDGMEFSFSEDYSACTCTIYRKDRSKPIIVTEFLQECLKPSSQPWKTHPKRMLRHKAMIQCARLAFGFTGIYDQDEAERIAESKEPINVTPKPAAIEAQAIELATEEQVREIKELVEITQSNMDNLLAYAGNAASIEQISKKNAELVLEKLHEKRKKQQPPQDNHLGEAIEL